MSNTLIGIPQIEARASYLLGLPCRANLEQTAAGFDLHFKASDLRCSVPLDYQALTLTMDQFSDRYVKPAVHSLIGRMQ